MTDSIAESTVYVRVSSKSQSEASQLPDLKRWAAANPDGVGWARDSFTGTTLARPGWERVWQGVLVGRVKRVIVWRLDRLGRTTSELSALFRDLTDRGVTLVSLRDGFDLLTPSGRLMAHVLASVAQYETEVRSERQLAGIAAAKAAGKTWGGATNTGKRLVVKPEQEETIRAMKAAGRTVAAIARATGLSRPTVYSVLAAAL
jgi:DNA invertase Pin-like site-specific DNA recombinase